MKDYTKAWISADDIEQTPEFVAGAEQEFFNLPVLNDLSSDNVVSKQSSGTNRRDFLKYLGFSLGAATIAAACETPVRKAIPYVTKPDAIVPGVAVYYASTVLRGGDWVPVLVKTREGRPIKIEGNAGSKTTGGGTSARAQASVLDLYDVYRLRHPGKVTENAQIEEMTWDEVDQAITSKLTATSRVRLLSNTIMSPSAQAAINDFKKKYSNTVHVSYDPVSASALLDANNLSFGKRVVPAYDFSKADVVVTFGADFLGTWISPVEYAHQWSQTRKVGREGQNTMSRMIAVEAMMSLTGSNADHRVLIKPSEQGLAIATLYQAIASARGGASLSAGGSFANEKAKAQIEMAAKDLIAAASAGKGTLVVSNSNNVAEQQLINNINSLLGNYGKTIDLNNYSLQRQGSDKAVVDLLAEMNSGGVDALFVLNDANPAFDLPEAEQFKSALSKVGLRVSLSGYPNETLAVCDYSCPSSHTLESWGDAQPKSNVYSLIQPTIAPLFKTRQYEMSLLKWADALPVVTGQDHPYHAYLQKVWGESVFTKQNSFSTFRSFWDSTLHDGILEIDSSTAGSANFSGDVASLGSQISKPSSSELELAVYESIGLGAGQYASNPWLQELPDPITRVCWANYVCVPVKWDGKSRFSVLNDLKDDGNLVDLTLGEKTHRLPIVKQFGLLQQTIGAALGFGREIAGKAGSEVGKNLYSSLKRDAAGYIQYYVADAQISGKVGHDSEFATVQHHHTMGVKGIDETINELINVDEKAVMTLGNGFQGGLTNRSILRSANFDKLDAAAESLIHEREHHQKLNSYGLYPGHDDQYHLSHHWGLAVDLTSCIGCAACQVACISENNVPVVGKKEVSRHHEMTWLRIDRYYYGDVESPNVVYQPMMCQHCDNAPCENVCPVAATNHSSEGLNQMAYNRCVGTRYCANNCPYKVRRFNWLDYTTADLFPVNENDPFQEDTPYYGDNLTRMVLNPDVTVRSRGVIEKCSFCVQRIQEGKLRAKAENRKLKDGDIKSACQTACPTGAIVFGDTNDPESEVSKRMAMKTSYFVLEEINVLPSVGYQMKVTNRNEA